MLQLLSVLCLAFFSKQIVLQFGKIVIIEILFVNLFFFKKNYNNSRYVRQLNAEPQLVCLVAQIVRGDDDNIDKVIQFYYYFIIILQKTKQTYSFFLKKKKDVMHEYFAIS